MRYILTWLTAVRQNFDDYLRKCPSGQIWAAPDKPSGYLRRSVLRGLAKSVGCRTDLPEDLIEAGAFDDPDTASESWDTAASVFLTLLIWSHWGEVREKERAEEENDDDGDNDTDDSEDSEDNSHVTT